MCLLFSVSVKCSTYFQEDGMRKLLVILIVLVLMTGVVGTTSAAAPTTVYLVNTLPTLMDVYLDGNLVLEDFAPFSIRGPLVGESNGPIRIDMIVANTVLDQFNGVNAILDATLPVGATVAIVAHNNNTPASLGDLSVVIYDFSRTGPGYANLLVFNALYGDDLEFVLSPGMANEEHLPTLGDGNERRLRLPAGPKTASVIVWGRAPLPEIVGPFMTDLQPGKLYAVFIYRTVGELRWLTQEFNVGQ
jgi:hypothetical protein